MTNQSYTDPSNISIQLRTGITQRAIINVCKRNGWPWRKISGRIWVCADFVKRYEAQYGGFVPPVECTVNFNPNEVLQTFGRPKDTA